MVQKNHSDKIFFKTSYLQDEYQSITLKRGASYIIELHVSRLYSNPPLLSKEKFEDLMALCHDLTPVVKLPEHVMFYESLPH